jgi:hypothetical protein
MIECILSFWMPGQAEILFILLFLGISIFFTIMILRFLLRNKKENIRLRLEVGKLADEIEQMRKQKGDEEGVSVNESS